MSEASVGRSERVVSDGPAKPAQCASAVLLVRPARFGSNPETAASNEWQGRGASHDQNADDQHAEERHAEERHADAAADADLQRRAAAEFDAVTAALRDAGVTVHVAHDDTPAGSPDAVFPNNWFVALADGRVLLCPMLSPLRRLERRPAFVAAAIADAGMSCTTSAELVEAHEADGRFVEGTGSLVLDRANRVAYACRSPRTDDAAARHFADLAEYDLELFDAFTSRGGRPYHTNVIMSIGERFAVLATPMLSRHDAQRVSQRLRTTDHEVIEISEQQVDAFAGNVLQLASRDGGRFIAMSTTAERALAAEQRAALATHGDIVAIAIPTLEHLGGGSVRCMVGEVGSGAATERRSHGATE